MILLEKFVSRIVILLDNSLLRRLKIGVRVGHEMIGIECVGVHFIICREEIITKEKKNSFFFSH
jgi:hypothetical protein